MVTRGIGQGVRPQRAGEGPVKTQEALSLLIALEERVARIYFQFFRRFRDDTAVARCWWDMARDEYGHAGILKMVRELASPQAESGKVGSRLWSLVEVVEHCERQADSAESLGRALELAIKLESSELDVLGHRIVHSLRAELPEGAARPFIGVDGHCRRLVEAAGKVPDAGLRQRLEALLSGAKGY
jgi:rubrerythrin